MTTAADDRTPRLRWMDDGSPRSGRYDDVYFSAEDGLAESRAVFLAGCNLPDAWHDRERFTVAELGFGTGLNIVALLHLWSRTRPKGAHLNIISIEGFPLSAEEARRALSAWPEVAAVAETLVRSWPPVSPGFHRVDLPGLNATLDLLIGDAAEMIQAWAGQADAWFLDGFSPALNPEMWSDAVLDAVAARSAPDAKLATFTVAGHVRRGLAERGFSVEKRPGHGRKRQRLEAHREGRPQPRPPRDRVLVVGGGIAGASVCRALAAQGTTPTLVEADSPGAGGSGFPSALVTARFDLGDRQIAGLYRQALERAGDLYRPVPGAVLTEGVVQLAGQPRDPSRFQRIAAQPIWPEGALALKGDALHMNSAMAVQPAAILDAWLAGVKRMKASVSALRREGADWILTDARGVEIARADVVILATGWGTDALWPQLGLAPVRGQAEWVEGTPPSPAAWGGYVAPTASGMLFGATHRRGRTDTAVSPEDTAANLATLASQHSDLAEAAAKGPIHSRAAVRATTPDRLPLCGPMLDQPGLFVLSGLGSRGFCVAPLLAEHLAALISGRPSPLPLDLAERLLPGRGR